MSFVKDTIFGPPGVRNSLARASGIGGYPASVSQKQEWAAEERAKEVPDQNAALNSSQAQRDQLTQRRGLLANIYAGAINSQPVTGKTSLGM